MDQQCPTCGRPTQTSTARRAELKRRIRALRREIGDAQFGILGVIDQQAAAPSCTICEQAAPGKMGQPTPAGNRVRALHRQLEDLEGELART